MSLIGRFNSGTVKTYGKRVGSPLARAVLGKEGNRTVMSWDMAAASKYLRWSVTGVKPHTAPFSKVSYGANEFGLVKSGAGYKNYNKALSSVERKQYASTGVRHLGSAARRLPMRTKIGVPIAAIGFAGWMNRRRKSRYYTHYFDF